MNVTESSTAVVTNGTTSHKKLEGFLTKLAFAVGGTILVFGMLLWWAFSPPSPKVVATSSSTALVGSVMAPAGKWSEPLRVPGTKCVRWWGKNPTGDAFVAEFFDPDREVWITYQGGDPKMTGVRFSSKSSAPEKVAYEISEKGTAACKAIP